MKYLVLKIGMIALQTSVDASGGAFEPYFDPLGNLMIAIGAIVGTISAFKIYKNWQMGEDNALKDVGNFILGCIMLLLTGVVLKNIYGIV